VTPLADWAPTYRQILVAVDGSRAAGAAVGHAVALARGAHARITLLTVAPRKRCLGVVGVPSPPDLTASYVAALRATVATVPPDVGLVTGVAFGDAAREIVRVAREGAHDVIVMGGQRGRRRRAHGAVTRRVLRDAPVAVLLVPDAGGW